MVRNAIQTKHNLDFFARPWYRDENFAEFKIGTCNGLYTVDETTYSILAIENTCKGNGHFEDVIQWFEHSCRRDRKNLMFLEVWNDKFATHLSTKRGFELQDGTCNYLKKMK